MPRKGQIKSHEQYCADVKAMHGNRVVPVSRYVGSVNPVKMRCRNGHTWSARPSDVLEGRGCKVCADNALRKTPEQFARQLNRRFELVSPYLGDAKPVKLRCIPCDHTWSVLANTALKQKWCPKCVGQARRAQPHKLTTEEVRRRIAAVNPHFVLVSEYLRLKDKVRVRCKHCDAETLRRPENVMRVKLKCSCKLGVNSGRGYSSRSIEWLEGIARKNRKMIQHAENGGEFRIPGHRLYVDGYHKRSNTVFEYLGDYWHKHISDDARKKTMQRLRKIQSLGYRVVYIWESEYIKGKAAQYL